MNIKKTLLALFLLTTLLLAACGSPAPGETEATTTGATSSLQTTIPSVAPVENPVNYIEISYLLPDNTYLHLSAYPKDENTVWVEYVDDIKKAAALELAALDFLTLGVEESGFAALNGANVFEEGACSASVYVSYENGNYIGASYTCAELPGEFTAAYNKLLASFKELMADVPEYVPAPTIFGQPNQTHIDTVSQLFAQAGVDYPDAFGISDIPLDDTFAATAGLSSAEGITCGTICAPLMSPNAFSLVLVNLAPGTDAEAIREDFIDEPDWLKWVCVSADEAAVASRGDTVIFIMCSSAMAQTLFPALEACGWENVETDAFGIANVQPR